MAIMSHRHTSANHHIRRVSFYRHGQYPFMASLLSWSLRHSPGTTTTKQQPNNSQTTTKEPPRSQLQSFKCAKPTGCSTTHQPINQPTTTGCLPSVSCLFSLPSRTRQTTSTTTTTSTSCNEHHHLTSHLHHKTTCMGPQDMVQVSQLIERSRRLLEQVNDHTCHGT